MSKLTNTFKLINSTTIKLNNQIYTLITKSETDNYNEFVKYNNNYYSITNKIRTQLDNITEETNKHKLNNLINN